MLNAIGIYNYHDYMFIETDKPKPIQSAQTKNMLSLFNDNLLASLEKETLPLIHNSIIENSIIENDQTYYNSTNDEHHYFHVLTDKNIIIAINSARKLDPYEIARLMINIEHIHMQPELARTNLQAVINNPLGFTSCDIITKNMQVDIQDTKQIMQTNIQKLTERGDKLAELEKTTFELSKNANKFNEGAKELNKCRC